MVLPLIARSVVSKIALKKAGKKGLDVTGKVASYASKNAVKASIAAAGGAAMVSSAVGGRREKNAYSTQNSPYQPITGPAHSLLFMSIFIVFIFLVISFFSEFKELVVINFIDSAFMVINLITGLNIQTQSVFATFNMDLFSIFYTILFIAIIFANLIFKEKAAGITTASVWLIFMPLIIYTFFVGLGGRMFSGSIVESINTVLFVSIVVLIVITTLILLTSTSQDAPQKINKEMKIVLLVLAVLWIVLLFASDSPFASGVKNDARDAQDDIAQETNNFATFWKCDVMQGEYRGVEECIEVEEEVNVKRATQDPFVFSYRSDSSSNVVREGRESARFIFDIEIPRTVDAKIARYSCRVGSNRTYYDLPAQYSSLTQGIEKGSLVSLQLDCPVMEKVSRRDDEAKVEIRINLEVEDRLVQRVPYIDCSNNFFMESSINCESVGRALALNEIDDPRIESFLNSLSDPVTGAHSTRATVSGIRGNLPIYLNSDNQFGVDSADYDITFKEYDNFLISNISISNIETPQYISVVESSLLDTISKREGDSSIVYPVEINFNDFSSNNGEIGGSEAILIDYIVEHHIERTKTIRVEHPQRAEDDETIADVVIGDSSEEESGEDTEVASNDQNSGESCVQQCGPTNSQCVQECQQNQESTNSEEDDTQVASSEEDSSTQIS